MKGGLLKIASATVTVVLVIAVIVTLATLRARSASVAIDAEAVAADTGREAELDAATGSEDPVAPPAAPRAPRELRPLNVVLVTIDTLRWDLGFAGYPRPITPNLDRFAERAVVFERAYATASYTPKSLGPLLIGRYASETFRDQEHYTTFYPANVFVAERLRDAGYRTIGAMVHHYFKWKTGFDQGFDVWDTSLVPAVMMDNDPSVTSDKLTDVAMRLLGDVPDDRPFFAWFHYLDPHLPYVAHDDAPDVAAAAPDAAPPEREPYDREVWFTDAHVGRLLDFIAAQAWAPRTAIIVTADHGEAFGERGFTRHGRELWESIVRVPLLVYVPDAPPHRVGVKRSHVDIVPTILELAAALGDGDPSLRGRSLLADVDAAPDAELEERDVYLDMPEGPFNEARRALITGGTPGTKAIDFGDGRVEVYDLAADPLETTPLDDPAARRAARAALAKQRAALEERAGFPARKE